MRSYNSIKLRRRRWGSLEYCHLSRLRVYRRLRLSPRRYSERLLSSKDGLPLEHLIEQVKTERNRKREIGPRDGRSMENAHREETQMDLGYHTA
jgi:hypothetical protein